MNGKRRLSSRMLAMVLSVLMILQNIPATAYAEVPSRFSAASESNVFSLGEDALEAEETADENSETLNAAADADTLENAEDDLLRADTKGGDSADTLTKDGEPEMITVTFDPTTDPAEPLAPVFVFVPPLPPHAVTTRSIAASNNNPRNLNFFISIPFF